MGVGSSNVGSGRPRAVVARAACHARPQPPSLQVQWNDGEAKVVMAHVARLVAAGIPAQSIGVITPYNAQARGPRGGEQGKIQVPAWQCKALGLVLKAHPQLLSPTAARLHKLAPEAGSPAGGRPAVTLPACLPPHLPCPCLLCRWRACPSCQQQSIRLPHWHRPVPPPPRRWRACESCARRRWQASWRSAP